MPSIFIIYLPMDVSAGTDWGFWFAPLALVGPFWLFTNPRRREHQKGALLAQYSAQVKGNFSERYSKNDAEGCGQEKRCMEIEILVGSDMRDRLAFHQWYSQLKF